jgi:hypothetical protein
LEIAKSLAGSPAEAISAAAGASPLEDEETPVYPPWEPKGLFQTQPQVTVEGVDLVGSPRPPETAGGAGPNNRTQLGRFGPDTGA